MLSPVIIIRAGQQNWMNGGYIAKVEIASFTDTSSWRIQLRQAATFNSWLSLSQMEENDATDYADKIESTFKKFGKSNFHHD